MILRMHDVMIKATKNFLKHGTRDRVEREKDGRENMYTAFLRGRAFSLTSN